MLLLSSKMVCKAYEVPLQELLDVVMQSGEGITKGMDEAFYNPPYTTCRIPDSDNSGYLWVLIKRMNVLVDGLSVVDRYSRALVHIWFCAAVPKLVLAVGRRARRLGEPYEGGECVDSE